MNAMMCGSASMDESVLGMENDVVVYGVGSASRRRCGWWGGSVVHRKVSWGHGSLGRGVRGARRMERGGGGNDGVVAVRAPVVSELVREPGHAPALVLVLEQERGSSASREWCVGEKRRQLCAGLPRFWRSRWRVTSRDRLRLSSCMRQVHRAG
jgi:hypothetical protein